eukprot:TRINITY_DN328_c0_g1_i1.p1 TRINITY_DN328_c0_g1~~TRINITY_DN328_c0_g1_i1.p1  ORF type:complete len:124 (-),score=36.55 TRINITY_DN328_c0_g1_i1:75-446(-)
MVFHQIYNAFTSLFTSPKELTPEEMADVEQKVESLIKENKVMVFSKSYCPYCVKAKKALADLGVELKVVELDEVDNGDAIQNYLQKKTNQRTVPNIFVKQQHIGGCDDTLASIKSGKLQQLVA